MDGGRSSSRQRQDEDASSTYTSTQPQKFWGQTVKAGESCVVSLESTELHITQVCITKPGRAIISVSTSSIEQPLPVAALRWPEGPLQQLLDLSFFPLDGAVTVRVDGGVDAHFAGSVALVGEPIPSDVDDDEEDDAENEGDVDEDDVDDVPPPVKEQPPSNSLSVAEKLKRRRDGTDDSPAPSKAVRQQSTAASARTSAAPGAPAAAPPPKPVGSKLHSKKQIGDAAAQVPTMKQEIESAAQAPAKPQKDAGAAAEAKSLAGGLVKVIDTHVGLGAMPVHGRKVTVAYEGRLGKGGKVFDRSSRFSFKLGAGEVIKGWDVGVAGMRVGGKRTLIIHPKYGYGAEGAGPDIPPQATLIFDVELLDVKN